MRQLRIVVERLKVKKQFANNLLWKGLDEEVQGVRSQLSEFVGKDERNQVIQILRIELVYFRDYLV